MGFHISTLECTLVLIFKTPCVGDPWETRQGRQLPIVEFLPDDHDLTLNIFYASSAYAALFLWCSD